MGGEGRAKYHFRFLSLDKSRANAKIMDSIKTDNGQTVTNQSDIPHVKKKNYFANVYKKKISGETIVKHECSSPFRGTNAKLWSLSVCLVLPPSLPPLAPFLPSPAVSLPHCSRSPNLPPPPSLSLYDRCFVNRYVFSCFLNVARHCLCLMCRGSEFQVAGPDTESDFFPKVFRENHGTTKR